MQLNKKKILILLGLILSLTGSGKEKSVLLPIIRSSFHTENGNIRNWREDGWCRGNLKIENSSPARVSCTDKMSALLHVRRFDVTPGERIRGTFQARGYANLTFALYLYDRKGFISSAAKGVKEDFTEGKTVDFSLEVPKTLKGRSPESAFFAMRRKFYKKSTAVRPKKPALRKMFSFCCENKANSPLVQTITLRYDETAQRMAQRRIIRE